MGSVSRALVVSLLTLWAIPDLQAQKDSTTCYADVGYRLWPDAAWQSRQDTVSRPASFVARTLSGSYRLIVIKTEGPGLQKFGEEWTLRLEPPPPDSAQRWARMLRGQTDVFPLWGSRRLVRSGSLNESLHPPIRDSLSAVRLRYYGGERLSFEGAPFNMMDGGSGIFHVEEVEESGSFSGRWVEGGLAIYVTPTPLGLLGEPSKGYFCAFRESP
jgi:hypothetical protein